MADITSNLKINQEVMVHFIQTTTLQGKIYGTIECYYKCRVLDNYYRPTDIYVAVEIIEEPNYGTQVVAEKRDNELIFKFDWEIPTIEMEEG